MKKNRFRMKNLLYIQKKKEFSNDNEDNGIAFKSQRSLSLYRKI